MSKLKITQTRSVIGRNQKQRDTLRTLGLKKIHQSVIQPDNPATRGKVQAVRFMVTVEEVD